MREAKNTTSTESEERINCNVVEQDEERACRTEAEGVKGMGWGEGDWREGEKEERLRDREPWIVTLSRENPIPRPEVAKEG